MSKFHIDGVDDLLRKLGKLSGGVKPAAEVAVVAGAQPINNQAKVNAPVLTGNLRRSLHVGDPGWSGTVVSVEIGTDVEYAPYQEFGTSRNAAQPFLRPAVDSMKGQAVNEAIDVLRDLVKEVT